MDTGEARDYSQIFAAEAHVTVQVRLKKPLLHTRLLRMSRRKRPREREVHPVKSPVKKKQATCCEWIGDGELGPAVTHYRYLCLTREYHSHCHLLSTQYTHPPQSSQDWHYCFQSRRHRLRPGTFYQTTLRLPHHRLLREPVYEGHGGQRHMVLPI